MEDGDSVRHLNYDRSTDCHEHYLVHGTWSYLYVTENASVSAEAFSVMGHSPNSRATNYNLAST